MERSGLGYEDMKKIKPDIISVSMKMYGNDGPLGYQTGYAPCFAALGGLNYLIGYEGEAPTGSNIRYGDTTMGAAAAFAAIAALMHRERTGEGQFVDVSAVECMSSMVGDSLFEHSLTGKSPKADGNRHADMAPHNCYRCVDDEWISIAVATEDEWRALCATLGDADLAGDPRFNTLAKRQQNLDALDARLSELTLSQHAGALAPHLRAAGVGAFKSETSLDLISDAELWGREFLRLVSDHTHGTRPVMGAPWRMSRSQATITNGSPKLGEHNDYVYREVLGLSQEKLDQLIAAGAVD
jgi:crotonobetainyl-CoA:carnitine CoA-transferase CaiB-like acyl-CoA transferase